MRNKTSLFIIIFIALLDLSGCSYVKSLFPDKEKDYQYTTEIPPLILPEDLKKSQIPGLTNATPILSTNLDLPTEESDNGALTPLTPTDLPKSDSESIDTEITVQRIKLNDGGSHLRINLPFIKAWRIVNKSLSRKSIEVTERNQETKLFTVKYDPEEEKTQQDSFWDELSFMLKEVHGNEKTCLIKLDENNGQTDIIMLDEDKKPALDATSSKLLTLIEETIKSDLATN